MVAFTQVPAFVYSVNGKRSNFYLSSSRGVGIQGSASQGRLELSVESKASVSAEILAVLPEGWKNAAATVNGELAEVKLLSSEPYLFARVAVAKGSSTVVVSERKEAGVAVKFLPAVRNPYEDRGVTFFSASEKPAMRLPPQRMA